MNKKYCFKCKQNKKLDEFGNSKRSKDGKHDTCKLCVKEYNKRKKFLGPEILKERNKRYYQNNIEYYESYRKEYNKIKSKINNTNQIKSGYKKDYSRKQYKINIQYKISQILRIRLINALKVSKNRKTNSAIKLLGCTIEEFRQYISKQFKFGMNWDNHGTVWEIDHIKPCASFDLSKEEEQRNCFHYSNLQPLFIKENRIKGTKY